MQSTGEKAGDDLKSAGNDAKQTAQNLESGARDKAQDFRSDAKGTAKEAQSEAKGYIQSASDAVKVRLPVGPRTHDSDQSHQPDVSGHGFLSGLAHRMLWHGASWHGHILEQSSSAHC